MDARARLAAIMFGIESSSHGHVLLLSCIRTTAQANSIAKRFRTGIYRYRVATGHALNMRRIWTLTAEDFWMPEDIVTSQSKTVAAYV